jgi:hypothetical protein
VAKDPIAAALLDAAQVRGRRRSLVKRLIKEAGWSQAEALGAIMAAVNEMAEDAPEDRDYITAKLRDLMGDIKDQLFFLDNNRPVQMIFVRAVDVLPTDRILYDPDTLKMLTDLYEIRRDPDYGPTDERTVCVRRWADT